MKAVIYILAMLAAFSVPRATAAEQDGRADWVCGDGTFEQIDGNYSLARVVGSGNSEIYFAGVKNGRPSADAACRREACLVPGDELLVTKRQGPWICGWLVKNQTIGWLPAAQLKIIPISAAPSLKDWTGEWVAVFGGSDSSLSIRLDSGREELVIEGRASWSGAGVVHTGGFSGRAKPRGDKLTVAGEAPDCTLRLRLAGPVLMARDNRRCGGANVTFTNAYRKQSPEVESILFNRAVISFEPSSFRLGQKKADAARAMHVYVSPRRDKRGERVNSSFGIILEKVPEDADPIMGYIHQLRLFGVYENYQVPKFTHDDDFMKIPNSCGTIFEKKYPDGRPHTILFVVSAKNGISIKIIADTTSDTFDALAGEYKNLVRSFKIQYPAPGNIPPRIPGRE